MVVSLYVDYTCAILRLNSIILCNACLWNFSTIVKYSVSDKMNKKQRAEIHIFVDIFGKAHLNTAEENI
jgi:hypothetical protein